MFENYNTKGLLDKDITELLIKLKELNKVALEKFKKIEISSTLDKNEYNKIISFVELITTGDFSEVLSNISYHFIPNEERAQEAAPS